MDSLGDYVGHHWPPPKGSAAPHGKIPSWDFSRTLALRAEFRPPPQRKAEIKNPTSQGLIGFLNWRSLGDSNPRYLREREVS